MGDDMLLKQNFFNFFSFAVQRVVKEININHFFHVFWSNQKMKKKSFVKKLNAKY